MTDCDATLTAMLFGRLDPDGERHLAGCAGCARERDRVGRVAAAFAADAVPAASPALALRIRRAAAPLLAAHARRAAWPALSRALVAALVPLPFILFADYHLVRWLHGVLSTVLPDALSLWVVGNYAATLALLLALTYSAIPILAERQTRLRHQESHG